MQRKMHTDHMIKGIDISGLQPSIKSNTCHPEYKTSDFEEDPYLLNEQIWTETHESNKNKRPLFGCREKWK